MAVMTIAKTHQLRPSADGAEQARTIGVSHMIQQDATVFMAVSCL